MPTIVDNRAMYLLQPKFVLIQELQQRNARLKYLFSRTKGQLVDILYRMDNGQDPADFDASNCYYAPRSVATTPSPSS